jgi:hypothetical protein
LTGPSAGLLAWSSWSFFMPRTISALLCVLLAAALVRAETYTIRIKNRPAKGTPVQVVDREKQVTKVKVRGADQDRDRDEETAGEQTYTETILQAGDKQPVKLQRVYKKATDTVDKKTKDRPYSGRTITFVLEDGKYKATADGDKPLPKAVLVGLARQVNEEAANRQRFLLPKMPVEVGSTWKLTGKDVAAYLGDKVIDKEQSKGTGKLVKVYKKDGKQFGVLQFDLQTASQKDPKKGEQSELHLTVDTAIDGSSTDARITGKVIFTRKASVSGALGTVNVEARTELTLSQVRTEGK